MGERLSPEEIKKIGKKMKYLKYLWLIGVMGGAWLIKVAWNDTVEGPYVRSFGLVVVFVCLVKLIEAIIADIKARDE